MPPYFLPYAKCVCSAISYLIEISMSLLRKVHNFIIFSHSGWHTLSLAKTVE